MKEPKDMTLSELQEHCNYCWRNYVSARKGHTENEEAWARLTPTIEELREKFGIRIEKPNLDMGRGGLSGRRIEFVFALGELFERFPTSSWSPPRDQ